VVPARSSWLPGWPARGAADAPGPPYQKQCNDGMGRGGGGGGGGEEGGAGGRG
jgi:hypothetical protein